MEKSHIYKGKTGTTGHTIIEVEKKKKRRCVRTKT